MSTGVVAPRRSELTLCHSIMVGSQENIYQAMVNLTQHIPMTVEELQQLPLLSL